MIRLAGFILTFLALAATACFMYLLVDLVSANPKLHKTDCALASFHPDIPKDVRKACRERGEA